MGLGRDSRVFCKALVSAKIRYEQEVRLAYGGRANTQFARLFTAGKTAAGLGPVSPVINKADGGDRTFTNLSGEFRDLLVSRFRCSRML
jgi:hypothetical protein